MLAWLVTYSANLLTWFTRGPDGQTAYQRVRGRVFNGKLLHFGEKCRYKTRDPDARNPWSYAVFIGRDNVNGQHILFDGRLEKIVRARTLMRLPNAQKWDCELLASLNVLPYDVHEARTPAVVFREQVEVREAPIDAVRRACRVYLKPGDFEGDGSFGYTDGCPKCEHWMRYGQTKTSAAHSEACRTRIMTELAKTTEGQMRIAAATSRLARNAYELAGGERAQIDGPALQGEKLDDVQVQAPFNSSANASASSNPFDRVVGGRRAEVAPAVDEHWNPPLEPCEPDPLRITMRVLLFLMMLMLNRLLRVTRM